ncbi:YdcF family protein [Paenibacillus sp. NEAU-GSW1]|uniref:YdcF family protein n=1 Tax=Paenibacillus sp. NEAU-GSW1 TaxID=2682486 RepID=UPI0012E32AFE|nr:YdcF family protein [Paenibacillus sp. NEAU-GSW1]MUT68371.1 YdcF family protein [Paenibacillus sp. NEAU-GSW1]
MNSVFIKRLLIAAAIPFIWFIIHTAFVIIDGLNDELKPADAAVVLGNKVERNGQPSERLRARLNKSLELYNGGYFTYIIVSGGTGKEGFDEAKVMKSYLTERGVPAEKIIEDNNGYNSYMTAKNTGKIMEELELDSVMIITQYFHVSRTKLAFRKMDIKEVYAAHAKFFEVRDIYSILREFPAFYKYLFKTFA